MLGLKAYTQTFTFTSQEDYSAISGIMEFVEEKSAEFRTSRKEANVSA